MRNKLTFLSALLFIFTLFFSWFSDAAQGPNQSDPQALLEYIADHMIAGLKTNEASLKTKPKVVYNLAYQYVVPYADLEVMSKRVLPPAIWGSASPKQRADFQKQFTISVIRTYASALTSYQDQRMHFFPLRGDFQRAKTVEVMGEISGGSNDPIQVTYRLIREGSQWRLYDMSVEGVSLLESFRSQFSDILANGTMTQLLNRMSTHNDR